VEVAFAAAWRSLEGWKIGCLELAQHCQKAENQYVGVNCGLMDQFASACAVPPCLHLTRANRLGSAALVAGTAIDRRSGHARDLSSSRYNQLRRLRAVRLLATKLP
jgi:galactokinase